MIYQALVRGWSLADTLASNRKDQIRKAAGKLFSCRGYQATSVRDIAEAVGIQGGSLYAHVESKEDLLWEIVNHSADRFFAAVEPIVDSDRETLQKLREAIVAHVGVITGDLDAAAVYSTEWRHLTAERRATFAGRRDEYELLFRRMVTQGIRERLLTPADERFATLFVLSSLNWVYQWFKPDGPLTSEEVARKMAEFLFDGLRRRTT
jgi:AcrR family transcriptional regulator